MHSLEIVGSFTLQLKMESVFVVNQTCAVLLQMLESRA